MKDNSIYKYMETHDKDHDVCKRIDNYMGDKKMITSSDMDKLLEDAEDVICNYTLLVFTDIKSIDVLIDKLFEVKLMMKGQFKPSKTVEYDY